MPLSEKKLKRSQTEIRIWTSGIFASGQILQFDGDQGRVDVLSEWVDEGILSPIPRHKLDHPRLACDWPSLLARLTELGTFTLPGEREVPEPPSDPDALQHVQVDGVTVTIEVATHDSYRAYAWHNLRESDRHEHLNPYIAQVLKILNALKLEFGVPHSQAPRWLSPPLALNQILLVKSAYTMGAVKISEFKAHREDRRNSGRMVFQWQTIRLTDDFSWSDIPPFSGWREITWDQNHAALPEFSLEFNGFNVGIHARENASFLVEYPDPESRELGEISRVSYRATNYTEFNQIDYLNNRHEFISAYADYSPPCQD